MHTFQLVKFRMEHILRSSNAVIFINANDQLHYQKLSYQIVIRLPSFQKLKNSNVYTIHYIASLQIQSQCPWHISNIQL